MNSPNEVSVRETGLGPESGEHAEGRHFSHGISRGHGLGPNERLLRSREDKMCLPVSKTFQYDSWLERDETEGRSVIWGCEGRPGTPVDERGDNLDFVPELAVAGTSFRQHVVNREAWGVRRHPSPKSSAAEPFGIWGDTDGGTSRRVMHPPSSVEGKQFSATELHSRGLGRASAWVTPGRGATNRKGGLGRRSKAAEIRKAGALALALAEAPDTRRPPGRKMAFAVKVTWPL
ncbi:hypothetical protein NN561_012395 [Cricetulus griseus]